VRAQLGAEKLSQYHIRGNPAIILFLSWTK